MVQTKALTHVVVVGAGPIGAAIAVDVARHPDLRLIGVVDVAPRLNGSKIAGVAVCADLSGVPISSERGDVAVVCTTSSFIQIAPTLRSCLARGLHVVSTCEELVWPWALHPALAAIVDAEARDVGRAVVGTGVNPGFLMDALPVFLSAISARIDTISVVRAQDAAQRRVAFQHKIGVGLSIPEFDARVSAGGFLHRGLAESAALIAAATGLRGTISETHRAITRGLEVDGVEQQCRVIDENGVVRVTLCFEAWRGHPDPRDEIFIGGEPALHMITRGVHGDVATRAIAVNAIAAVRRASPGVRTMLDLPVPNGRFARGSSA